MPRKKTEANSLKVFMPKSWLTLKCFQKRKKKKKTFCVIAHKREQGRNLLKKDLRKKRANIK
jgi:hypothetical protein